MATNPNDKPENKGLRGIINKNFSRDEEGKSFLLKVFSGAVDGTTLGMSIRKDGFLPTYGAMFALLLGTGFIADGYERRVDINLPTSEITQNESEFTAYQYNGQRYLLQNTDEGARLFVKDRGENSSADDLYVLVEPDRAEEIAREMARLYLSEIGVDDPDFALLLENMPDIEGPITFNYEHLSVTFQQGEDGRIYVIGDNIDTQSQQSWDATDTSLQEGFDNWRSALTHFNEGNILSVETQSPSGDYLEKYEDQDMEFFLYALGLLALGGGASAAGQSIVASRRRHKKENQLRP